MRILLLIGAFALFFATGLPGTVPGGGAAYAQSMGDISGTLSRLKNNPRYQGRILGTHIRQNRDGYVYEVRILRPDDRIILVYIDPQTGGVVGDSDRSRGRNTRNGDHDFERAREQRERERERARERRERQIERERARRNREIERRQQRWDRGLRNGRDR